MAKSKKKKRKNNIKIKKEKQTVIPRFRWIAIVYTVVLICILFVRYYTPYLAGKGDLVIWCVGFLFTVWFLFDYELLQSGKYYLFSLTLSLIHLIFAQIILHNADAGIYKDLSILQPLLLIIFQFPMRHVFIFIMDREPMPDRHGPWQDKLYGFILMCCSFLPLFFTLINEK